jgi:hypothetical protein
MGAMTGFKRGGAVLLCLAAVAPAALAQTKPSKATPPPSVSNVQEKGVRVIRPTEAAYNVVGPVAPEPAKPTPAPVQRVDAMTPAPGPVAPVIKLCSRPFKEPALTLSADLDRRLARELRAQKVLVVDLPQPYPERADPPAALSPWLSEVESAGGTVTVKQYCSAAKGSLGSWLAKIGRVIRGNAQAASPYAAARGYDVVLHADALDRVITQVEFRPKAAPGA